MSDSIVAALAKLEIQVTHLNEKEDSRNTEWRKLYDAVMVGNGRASMRSTIDMHGKTIQRIESDIGDLKEGERRIHVSISEFCGGMTQLGKNVESDHAETAASLTKLSTQIAKLTTPPPAPTRGNIIRDNPKTAGTSAAIILALGTVATAYISRTQPIPSHQPPAQHIPE